LSRGRNRHLRRKAELRHIEAVRKLKFLFQSERALDRREGIRGRQAKKKKMKWRRIEKKAETMLHARSDPGWEPGFENDEQ